MSRQKDLAKNTVILSFGKICTQCISFFLLPLYTALLDTSEYGSFDLLVTYGTLFLPIVNWQFDQGIFRFMLDCRGDRKQQSELFSTIFTANTFQVILYSFTLGIIIIAFDFSYGLFLLAYVVFHVYTALLLQFARGLGKNAVYAVASFISTSVSIIINVVTLVLLRMGLNGLFVATLISQIITIVYLLFSIKAWRYFSVKNISRPVFKQVSKYSLPLIPNNIAWWVVSVSDRTIVSNILGVSINGIYTVANKFSSVFIQFYNIFNLSWTESVSLHYKDEDRNIFLSEMITIMYKLFSCACLGIVALMPFIFPIMINERYEEAYSQIIILMYSMLCRVVVGLYSCIYIAQKNSRKVAYTSAAAAIINVIVHLALIWKIGLYAASISTLIAFGSMAVIRYVDINKKINMKIAAPELVSSIILACALAVTYHLNIAKLNIIMLFIICVYAIWMNWGLAVFAKKIVVDYLKAIKKKVTPIK